MFSFYDLEIAAKTIFGEARGESYEGKVAVAHVLLNRYRNPMGPDRGKPLAQVCLRPFQFSCWNSNDPNLEVIRSITTSNRVFRECIKAFIDATLNHEDPTKGSRHYHTRQVAPRWSRGLKPVFTAGNHLFFNNVP